MLKRNHGGCWGATTRVAMWAGVATLVVACSQTLEWRDNVVVDNQLFASFPCHPDRLSRAVDVAGSQVQIDMLTCSAGNLTYAVSRFDASDPARITGLLAALRTTLVENVSAADAKGSRAATGAPRAVDFRLSGMTANPQAGRWAIDGHRPDGAALHAEAAFFTRGLRVYQATVVGSALPGEAVAPFFAGLRFPG